MGENRHAEHAHRPEKLLLGSKQGCASHSGGEQGKWCDQLEAGQHEVKADGDPRPGGTAVAANARVAVGVD